MKLEKEIEKIILSLEENGFEGYLVGGCVRDMLRGFVPKDFDIATNANPEEIRKIFKKSYINNDFGTVTVISSSKEGKREIQITPYRTESDYSDKRRPQNVYFVKTIEEDLKRRDFTINAIAFNPKKGIVDPYNGKKDIEKKIVRAVGDPKERIAEDALRMMRAVRFFATLDFTLEKETEKSIAENADLLSHISQERIRDEFVKIIMSSKAKEGVEKLRKLGLLKEFLPEIIEGYNIKQNKHHIYDCYQHAINALEYAAKRDFNMHVRMASLLHDVGKPKTKRGEGESATFYNHEIVGAKMAKRILERMKFKKDDIKKITLLVRYHLFYYNVGEVSESSIRRLIRNVGKENIEELLMVRMADRIGSGVPKAEPYKLRHMRYLIEKVSSDPISTNMLKIKGDDVMKKMNLSPGPVVGDVLNILLSKVIEEPSKNKKETLLKEIKTMKDWDKEKIKEEADFAKREIEKVETKRDELSKKRYWVT